MNFNGQNQNEISNIEVKIHKKLFSSVSFAFLAYIILTQGLAVVAALLTREFFPELLESGNYVMWLNAIVQYAIAFPILLLIVRRIPKCAPKKEKINASSIFGYLLVGMLFMYVGSLISQGILTNLENIFGSSIEDALTDMLTETDWYLSLLFVGILAPIVEELMFRKIFIDRLTPYGSTVAILFPSLIFGLFHGNLYQFFYAFALGMIFSYIYVRTGKIIYPILLHMFINVFCGVLPSMLMTALDYNELLSLVESGADIMPFVINNFLPLMLLGLYELIYFGLIVAGIVVFIRSIKRVRLEKGRVRLPASRAADVIFFNPGAIALITSCIIIIALNTIPSA